MEVRSASPEETQHLAAELAARIISEKQPRGTATIIALEGELGAGKTTFVQGFIRALGVTESVRSPTFLLMKTYAIKNRMLYHIDCYRVRDSQDLVNLEIKSIFGDPQNIVLIEWPERIADIIPEQKITVHLDHVDATVRQISVLP